MTGAYRPCALTVLTPMKNDDAMARTTFPYSRYSTYTPIAVQIWDRLIFYLCVTKTFNNLHISGYTV